MLSVLIPAHDEEGAVAGTVRGVAEALRAGAVPFEIVVVDDHSADGTAAAVTRVAAEIPNVRCVPNVRRPKGFGNAIATGLEEFRGSAVCIVMADASDDPADIVAFWRAIESGYDCAFGTRFTRAARVVEYPLPKLVLNRAANAFIALLFGMRYNDVTNAFKCYRREVIEGVQPILSRHFNITVELPLKAIVRGYSWTVVPTSWYNRKHGVSKFKIKEMGSRYLFIVLYALIEKWLSRGDYKRRKMSAPAP
ncbi:MAG TPA: glycosyltransferase family 2 protein [Candidatus Elarobacter sp.]|nr:glycosyltransferase family 2 protein [Candidatus Elarobacter sp.]